MLFPVPQIPSNLLRPMEQIVTAGHYDSAAGGQWASDEKTRVPFQGVVLPVGSKELQYAPAGTFTKDSRILYTNQHTVEAGQLIYDPGSQQEFTVKQELSHSPLHPMKRYAVETKGGSQAK